MRKIIFNLHLYLALVAGLFVLILGVTGAIMAFETELSDLMHAKLVFITRETKLLSLAEIGAVVAKDFPGEKIKSFTIATSPDHSYGVALNRKTVHVNPYTGAVLGIHFRRDNADIFLEKVHQLHLRLLVINKADSGKEIIRWSGVALIFLLISGTYLWWPRKRMAIHWQAKGNWTARNFWYDVHNAIGIFSLVPVLVLSVTGVAIGFQRQATSLFSRVTHSEPIYPPNVHLTPPVGATAITPDQALDIARTALPGAAPFDLILPGPTEAYDIRSRYPEDRTGGGRSRILVDQYSGKVIFAPGSRTAPAAQRLVILNPAIHTGDLFGRPSKILMSLASVAVTLQVFTGVLIWWKRIKTNTQRRAL